MPAGAIDRTNASQVKRATSADDFLKMRHWQEFSSITWLHRLATKSRHRRIADQTGIALPLLQLPHPSAGVCFVDELIKHYVYNFVNTKYKK